MKFLFRYFSDKKLKRFEKKMKQLKPELLLSWYETQENNIRLEYEEEIEKLQDELFDTRQKLLESRKSSDFWKGKYEGVLETQDKVNEQLITKIESSSMTSGKLKEQVKQLKDNIKEEKKEND